MTPQAQRAERDQVRPKRELRPIVRIRAHPMFPRYWMVFERRGEVWSWVYPPYRTHREALVAARKIVDSRRSLAAQKLADAVFSVEE